MGAHFGLMFMLLFVNLSLGVIYPLESGVDSEVLQQFVAYDEDTGIVSPNSEYQDTIDSSVSGSATSVTGALSFFDPFFIVFALIDLVQVLFLGLPTFLFNTTLLSYSAKLILGVMTFYVYVYTTIGFIRTGA